MMLWTSNTSAFSTELASTEAHIHDSHVVTQIVLYSVLMAIALVSVVVRIALAFNRGIPELDDFFCLFSLVTACAFAIIMIQEAHYGMGRHIWSLSSTDLVRLSKLHYAGQIIYPIAISTAKMATLVQYRRIFTQDLCRFRISLYVVGAFAIAWALGMSIATVFQCSPIRKAWNTTDMGHCFDILGAFSLANALVNIAIELILPIMPVSIIRNLNMKRRMKWIASGRFMLGGL